MAVEQLLPDDFTFSQSNLQAFVDCERRFWLTYVEQLPWPAIVAAPVDEHEQALRLGERFHRLIERNEIGVDVARVAEGLEPPLSTWFGAYLQHRPAGLPSAFIEVESVLSIPFGPSVAGDTPPNFRLAAKFDLIAAERDGRVVIVDWKTAKRRSDPPTLARRLQSVVYPYVLVEASAVLPYGPVRPEQVEMCYWFTAAPSRPVILRYDAVQHAHNRDQLTQLVAQILAGRTEADFPKVDDTELNRSRFCAYCIYRSRCDRGEAAGELAALDDDTADQFATVDVETALDFTLAEVEELAF